MQNQTDTMQKGIESNAGLEELIEKGNQLHNQAIFDFFIRFVPMAGLLKKQADAGFAKTAGARRQKLSFQNPH